MFTPSPSPSRQFRNVADWILAIEHRLDREQPFQAFDIWKTARELHPEHLELGLLGVLSLLQGRSLSAARTAYAAIEWPGGKIDLSARARAAQVARLFWELEGQEADLAAARANYTELFEEGQDLAHGVEAAVLAYRMGDREASANIADTLRTLGDAPEDEPPARRLDRLMNLGHAALILGHTDEALTRYREATKGWRGDYKPIVAALRLVRSLGQSGVPEPAGLVEVLSPPNVVIFGGQTLDPPGLDEPMFPPSKELAVLEAIRQALDEIDARIGYSSLACGGDILFAEAMLARGGELHVVLPCDLQDFIEAKVAYAGEDWVARFESVRARASSIAHATTERYLGHDALLRYANDMITGLGWIRAELLLTEPHLLAVWHFMAQPQPGSPADFIDHWADIKTLHLLELDDIEEGDGPDCTPQMPSHLQLEPQRKINAMLFADVVGYSKLGEQYLPAFIDVLAHIQGRFDDKHIVPALIEAWGDALYIVTPSAREMLRCAFELRSAFSELDPDEYDLPVTLDIRIGLHAGPVFPMVHPMTNRPIYSGSQVNRAARIEPITMPGEVYASTEYVALLTAEERAHRNELRFRRETYSPWYRWEYLGILDLPKKFGQQAIYHLVPIA